MSISAGVAYVDVLPDMKKFAPALAAQTSGATGVLSKFAKVGVLATGAVAAGSVKMAVDFEQSMRNVNSIARLPEPAFKSLNEEVLKLAGPTAQAPKTLADGLYDLVSSGFDAKDSLTILESSARAATAGLTTTDVATKGVAAVLNAYRLPAEKAGIVSDQLFRTVDRGVISFEELAGGIGDTLPFAAALGVGLDEVGASTATMTKQGLSGAETFTRIRNLLQTMIKPGEDLGNAIETLGYKNGEALIKAEGFQGALEALVGTTDGTKDEVAKLFPNIRALGGALALTGKNSEEAQKDLRGMGNAAGATKKAFDEQSKSLAVQWQELKARISVLAIEIGNKLIPALSDAVQWINEGGIGNAIRAVTPYVTGFVGVIKDIAGAIKTAGGAVADWVSQAVTDVKSFISNFLPLQALFGAIKLAIATLAPAFNVFVTMLGAGFKVVGEVVSAVWDIIKGVFDFIGNAVGVITNLLSGDFAGAWDNVKGAIGAVVDIITGSLKGAFDIIVSVLEGLRDVGLAVFGAIGDAIDAVLGPIDDIIDAFGDIAGAVDDATGQTEDLAQVIKTISFLKVAGEVDTFNSAMSGMGNAVVAGVAKATGGFKDFEKQIGGTVDNVGRSVTLALGEIIPEFRKVGERMGRAITQGIKSTGQAAIDAAKTLTENAAKAADTEKPKFGKVGREAGDMLGKQLASTGAMIGNIGKNIAAEGVKGSNSQRGAFQGSGKGHGDALAAGLRSTQGANSTASRALAIAAATAARAAVGAFQAAGASMGNALAAGLRSAIGGVAAAANALAAAAARANSNHRAAGGPVTRGEAYTVGERGRELFIPSTNGYIIPNHALPALGVEPGGAHGGRARFVIENWREGIGYFDAIANSAVDNARNFDAQRARMG